MPTVSIILPTYNRRHTLLDSVESLLNQTFTDFEVIIVDDGSTDRTHELLEDLCKKDKRFRYYFQENKGRSAARNHGLRLAAGKYISFLDSDDFYLPIKVQRQIEVLGQKPDIDFVYCGYSFIGYDGKSLPDLPVPSYDLSGNIYPEILFFKGTTITTPSVMVRRELFDRAGLFDEKMDICEDLDLWRRMARISVVEQIKEKLVVVRIRENAKLPYWDFLKARQHLYEKAFSEDEGLRNIRVDLYAELYAKYALGGLRQRSFLFFLSMITKLILLGPAMVSPVWKMLKKDLFTRQLGKGDGEKNL